MENTATTRDESATYPAAARRSARFIDHLLMCFDAEMDHPNPETGHLLEVAVVITRGDGTDIVIDNDGGLARCAWFVSLPEGHQLQLRSEFARTELRALKYDDGTASLADKVCGPSAVDVKEVDRQLVALIQRAAAASGSSESTAPRAVVQCGYNVHTDREFLRQWLPQTFALLDHNTVDVASLKILCYSINGFPPRTFPQHVPNHIARKDVLSALAFFRTVRELLRRTTLPIVCRDSVHAPLCTGGVVSDSYAWSAALPPLESPGDMHGGGEGSA